MYTHYRVQSFSSALHFEYKHLRTTLFTEYTLLCLYSFFVHDNRSRHMTTAFRLLHNDFITNKMYITTFYTIHIKRSRQLVGSLLNFLCTCAAPRVNLYKRHSAQQHTVLLHHNRHTKTTIHHMTKSLP